MEHEIYEKEVNVMDTDISFETILTKSYIPQEYIEDIKEANFLLIPYEEFRKNRGVFFSEITEEFFDYAKENAIDGIKVDIACSDEDFAKLELHSATIIIPTFIVTSIVLPFGINLVSNYLYDCVKKRNRTPDRLSAEVNIIVQDGDKSKQITYKGPVEGIKDALNSASAKMLDK